VPGERLCRACKAEIPPNAGPGRPRVYCAACVPPGTGKAAMRAWRAVNPGYDESHNAARRKSLP
jgi:hypothetical protein